MRKTETEKVEIYLRGKTMISQFPVVLHQTYFKEETKGLKKKKKLNFNLLSTFNIYSFRIIKIALQ